PASRTVPIRRTPPASSAWTYGRWSTRPRTWRPDRDARTDRPQARGPAAPAGATGPRRSGPPLRALRHRRGCDPGGTARGHGDVAPAGYAGRPEGLDDRGRLSPSDRSAPKRPGSTPTR